jgi:uncharacterized protein (DUF1778 family)
VDIERANDPVLADEETATFNARVPKRIKTALQRAADLRGQSLSEFVMGSAYDRAKATIAEEHILQLSQRDSELFAAALIGPATAAPEIVSRFLEAHKKSQRAK